MRTSREGRSIQEGGIPIRRRRRRRSGSKHQHLEGRAAHVAIKLVGANNVGVQFVAFYND